MDNLIDQSDILTSVSQAISSRSYADLYVAIQRIIPRREGTYLRELSDALAQLEPHVYSANGGATWHNTYGEAVAGAQMQESLESEVMHVAGTYRKTVHLTIINGSHKYIAVMPITYVIQPRIERAKAASCRTIYARNEQLLAYKHILSEMQAKLVSTVIHRTRIVRRYLLPTGRRVTLVS